MTTPPIVNHAWSPSADGSAFVSEDSSSRGLDPWNNKIAADYDLKPRYNGEGDLESWSGESRVVVPGQIIKLVIFND